MADGKGVGTQLARRPTGAPEEGARQGLSDTSKIPGPWLGGSGVLIPFRPKPTASPATQSPQLDEALEILLPGQEDPEALMKGARIAYERQALELASSEKPA